MGCAQKMLKFYSYLPNGLLLFSKMGVIYGGYALIQYQELSPLKIYLLAPLYNLVIWLDDYWSHGMHSAISKQLTQQVL